MRGGQKAGSYGQAVIARPGGPARRRLRAPGRRMTDATHPGGPDWAGICDASSAGSASPSGAFDACQPVANGGGEECAHSAGDRWSWWIAFHDGCASVLVEVDQVAAGIVEDRVHAAVVHPGGLLDEHHTLGLETLRVALAVVGAQRDHRPTDLAAVLLERPRGLHGQPALGGTVGGVGLDLEAEHLGVEPLGLVLIVDEDSRQSDAHRVTPFLAGC